MRLRRSSVRELSALYYCSGPVLREALLMLTVEGRVRTIPGKGTLVLPDPLPRHVVQFDPERPWRDLTPFGSPRARFLAAPARLAALLGIGVNDPVRLVEQVAIHRTGARVRTRRALVFDRVEPSGLVPDLAGPWEAVVRHVAETWGPLRVHDRYGAAVPDEEDRAALQITAWPALVLSAAAVVYPLAGLPLAAALLHLDATEAEVSSARR